MINGDTKKTLLQIIIPVASLLIGVGIAYGVIKTQIDNHSTAIERQIEINMQINTRLSFIEGALSIKERPFKQRPLGIQNN